MIQKRNFLFGRKWRFLINVITWGRTEKGDSVAPRSVCKTNKNRNIARLEMPNKFKALVQILSLKRRYGERYLRVF